MILVTGGAGFIGANFILEWFDREEGALVNIDALTYAGNLGNLASLQGNSRHIFVRGDIADRPLMRQLLQKYKPQAIVHFAAETHVDRSIDAPTPFLHSNVIGTVALLDECLHYWQSLTPSEAKAFRFIHVSTDEVYGSIAVGQPPVDEGGAYAPNSPYAASKASADHFCRAYWATYGLPVLITHSSNNYGPYQFPEKLIPLMIVNALEHKPLPLYGDGLHRRNWLYVADHCRALRMLLRHGIVGENYNIGSSDEMSNKELLERICDLLEELKPSGLSASYRGLISHVEDRPGHDRRYALDSSKIRSKLSWSTEGDFSANLRTTIQWYLENMGWVQRVMGGEYRQWITANYSNRKVK